MTALSPLHEMLATIELQTDAKRINEIVNHPEILPWVSGDHDSLDLTEAMKNENTIVLLGEHGGVAFHQHMTGLWVAHTQVLPEGRGSWAALMAQACMHWLFTRTNAVEIMTPCPKGNVAAKALARHLGFRYEFTNRLGWTMGGKIVPADYYGIRVQDWMANAPGLVERGQWFHDLLEDEFAKLGKEEPQHEEDLAHDRYVGAAYEMAKGGQVGKGMTFYNRWATLSGYAPVSLVSEKPLTINIQNALIVLRNNGAFYVASILDP